MKKTIKLSRAYVGHGRSVDEVNLREPTGWMVVELGDPYEWLPVNGTVVFVRNGAVIRSYLEQLIDIDLAVVEQLGVRDMKALERGLFDFFVEPKASEKSSTPSGSDTDATSTQSDA